MLDFLNARTDIRRKAGEIYGAIVAQARRPAFYAALGVPDTPAGRYEMVVIHLFLVLERLRAEADAASPLPRLLVEAFIADMDDSLREMGTGDLAVPKKVRRAATGLYERSMAYKAALDGRRRHGAGGSARRARLRTVPRPVTRAHSPATCGRRPAPSRQPTRSRLLDGEFRLSRSASCMPRRRR